MAELVLASKVRDLLPKDLAEAKGKSVGSKTPSISRIRDSHHNLARLLAEGLKDVDIARITGYSPSRISILKADPAFSELVSHYQRDKSEGFATVHERYVALSKDAAEELQARLDEKPESFDNEELMELTKLAADRTGFGPKQTNVNINLDLADRLTAARKRIGTLDLSPEPPREALRSPAPQLVSADLAEGPSPSEDSDV